MSEREPVHAEWVVSCEPTPFALIPEELIYDKQVQHGAVRLWAALMRHANKRGEAWPSLRTLATLLGVNRTTIMRWRDHLEDEGWLHVAADLDRNNEPTGRRRVWLFWAKVDTTTGELVHERTGGSHQRNTQSHQRNGGVAPAQRHLIESQEREPVIENTSDARVARAVATDDVERVWQHWLDVATRERVLRDVTRWQLTKGRRDAIRARLRDGYDVEQLTLVVDSAFSNPHHRSNGAYLDPASIFGSARKVDQHLARAQLATASTRDEREHWQRVLDGSAAMDAWLARSG